MWSSVTSLSRPRVENETRTIEIKPLCTRLMYIVTSWGYTVFQKRKREEFFYTAGEGVDVSTEQQQQPNATCHLLRGGYTRLENISRYRGGIGRVLVFAWTVQSQHSIVCWSTITCPTCSCCWLGVVNSFANVAIQFYSWGEKKVLDTWNFLIGNLDKRMWLFPVWGTAEREKKNETDWRGALDNLVLGKKAEPVGREVLQSMGA